MCVQSKYKAQIWIILFSCRVTATKGTRVKRRRKLGSGREEEEPDEDQLHRDPRLAHRDCGSPIFDYVMMIINGSP